MIPDAIEKSWKRSVLSGVDPEHFMPRYGEVNTDTIILRTARDVLGHAVGNLADTSMSMALTDSSGRIVWRWADNSQILSLLDQNSVAVGFDFAEQYVGTNGAGTVLETGRPVMIQGGQHYADTLKRFACFAAPIVHPITGHHVGALSISCESGHETPLMRAMVLQLGRDITNALLHRQSLPDRQLLDQFTRAAKTRHRPVLAVNQNVLICDRRSTALHVDHAALWEQVHDLTRNADIVVPGHDELTARCEPVIHQGKLVGSILTLNTSGDPATTAPVTLSTPLHHWDELATAASSLTLTHGRLLVYGESAVGKTTLATQVLRLSPADVIDATNHNGRHTEWLSALSKRLDADNPAIVLSHLDQLPESSIPALHTLLENALSRDTVVAITAGTRALSDHALQPIRDLFAPAVWELPPLRERRSAIADEAQRLAAELPNGGRRFDSDALDAMTNALWPGNYRQLREVVEQSTQTTGIGARRNLDLSDLPEEFRLHRRILTPIEEAEAVTIRRELRAAGGNKKQAAERLGISRGSLYSKVRQYRINESF